jgi:acyl-coenzyme A thioesterase PaaI-like protein
MVAGRPLGTGIATISESTSFLQGVRHGRITARAQVVKVGRRVAFVQGQAFSEDESVLTETRASFAIISRRQ